MLDINISEIIFCSREQNNDFNGLFLYYSSGRRRCILVCFGAAYLLYIEDFFSNNDQSVAINAV